MIRALVRLGVYGLSTQPTHNTFRFSWLVQFAEFEFAPHVGDIYSGRLVTAAEVFARKIPYSSRRPVVDVLLTVEPHYLGIFESNVLCDSAVENALGCFHGYRKPLGPGAGNPVIGVGGEVLGHVYASEVDAEDCEIFPGADWWDMRGPDLMKQHPDLDDFLLCRISQPWEDGVSEDG